MKQRSFTKTMVAIALLTMVVGAKAQSHSEFSMSSDMKSGLVKSNVFHHDYGDVTVYSPSRTFNKAEEEGVKLTLKLEYDQDSYYCEGVHVFNKNAWYHPDVSGGNTAETQIKRDTYDIVAIFQNSNQGISLVIKELVDIQQDTEITIDPETATNHISVKNYGPDGTILKHSWGEKDPETGQIVPVEEGNVNYTFIEDIVICKGIGLLLAISYGKSGAQKRESWKTLPFLEYDVNDVSDRYLFGQIRLSRACNTDEYTYYVSCFATDDVKMGELTNDPEKYVLCDEKWIYSPFGNNVVGNGTGILANLVYDNYCQTSYGISHTPLDEKTEEDISLHVYINSPSLASMDDKLKLFTRTAFYDHATFIGDEWFGHAIVWGVPIYIEEDGTAIYTNLNHINAHRGTIGPFCELVESYDDTSIWDKVLPAHPAFTYAGNKRKSVFGDNCPINAVEIKNYTNPWMMKQVTEITPCYVGRCGEIRWCDEESTVSSYKFNGEEIENGEITDTEGVFDVTIENTNIVVDGLNGRNTTYLHYDMTKEDNTPPTIEMLIFKNGDNEITDRFDTGSDGIMEFSAADFNYQYYEEYHGGVFDCQPLNVKVEYAPYETEEWTVLDIEEIPELFREIGWGYFYRASLKDVKGEAEKGWFDLRFSMSDNSDNTHVQTVSPAFRIDDCTATGISELSRQPATTAGTWFSLDGKRNVTPHKGLNIVRQADGTVRKVTVR